MYSQQLAQGHHSLVAVDRYTDPIDRIVREKRLSRVEKMRISRKSRVSCDHRERPMCACCTIHPSEDPERLGLRVLRARGCRGGKQQKVGWSKTMVWPPERSEPSAVGSGC